MPNYSYYCSKCETIIEHFFYIKDYKETIKCDSCKSKCKRSYDVDMTTINGSVKKSDSELKTLGDLANRNRDRLNDDQRASLHAKHNAYKEQESTKELPSGMSRIKKSKNKIKWR